MSSEAIEERAAGNEIGGEDSRPLSPGVIGEQLDIEEQVNVGGEGDVVISLSSRVEESQTEHGDESLGEPNARMKQVNLETEVEAEA